MIFNKFRLFTAFFIAGALFSCNDQSPETTKNENDLTNAEDTTKAASNQKTIVFFGNSLSAGYGVEPHESFPALIQARLDSLGYAYQVINAGVSGETTATGLNRLDWVLEKQTVDIFVLELGANDGLRGLPPEQTQKNLEEIIDKVRTTYPEAQIILAGMMVPPSMGPDYSAKYNLIFPETAAKKDVALIPFLLEDVGGVDSLNQSDGIHPNPRGNTYVADNVWEVLEDFLEKKQWALQTCCWKPGQPS